MVDIGRNVSVDYQDVNSVVRTLVHVFPNNFLVLIYWFLISGLLGEFSEIYLGES